VRKTDFGVLLTVAYEGTHFHGWATQREGRTVEAAVAGAIAALDPHASGVRGTSRTDAGVHAEGQLAAFDATLDIPPRGWVLALNQHLPDDVAVRSARRVPAGFAPRFANRGKRYRYRLLLDRVRDPLRAARTWRLGWPLDLERMAREASHVVGTHDFGGFRGAHDERTDTTRTITRCGIEREDDRVVSIVIEGNAFLYNMVRIIVGTLVEVARGKLAEGATLRTFASRARASAGPTAPAHGLTLEWVDVVLPDDAGAPWPR
jgi:tRNA pseudouridine38-40 synthase